MKFILPLVRDQTAAPAVEWIDLRKLRLNTYGGGKKLQNVNKVDVIKRLR